MFVRRGSGIRGVSKVMRVADVLVAGVHLISLDSWWIPGERENGNCGDLKWIPPQPTS